MDQIITPVDPFDSTPSQILGRQHILEPFDSFDLTPSQMWGLDALRRRIGEDYVSPTQPCHISNITPSLNQPDSRETQLRSRLDRIASIITWEDTASAWEELVRYVTSTAMEDLFPEAATETSIVRARSRSPRR